MRASRVLGLACLAGAAALFLLAASRGELRGGLFLIVPYFVGTGLVSLGGMLLLMAGFALLLVSAIPRFPDDASAERGDAPRFDPPERRSASGGVVLLGPIPIVWGSDKRVLPWMVGLGAALLGLTLFVWLTMARP